MDFRLTREQESFKDSFGSFCRDEIASRARETDTTGQVPPEAWNALVKSGYLKFFHPEDVGGRPLDPISLAIAMESLSHACASTAWKATIDSNVCGRVFARLGKPKHR